MRVVSLVPFVIFAVLATSAVGQEPSNEWRYFGGDEAFTRYAPFDQIDRHNVDKLELVWRRPAADPELQRAFPDLQPNAYLKSTPVIIDGVLYAPNAFGLVEAFDPATGETIWRQPPFVVTEEELAGSSIRGVAYWSDGNDQRLLLVRGEYLYALEPATGRRIPGFGLSDQGRAHLHWDRPLAEHFSWSGGQLSSAMLSSSPVRRQGQVMEVWFVRRLPKMSVVSMCALVSCSGPFTSCLDLVSLAPTRGAMGRVIIPGILVRGAV